MNTTTQASNSRRDPIAPHFSFSGTMHPAMDSMLRNEIFRLRYEVYCQECRYLDPLNHQNGLETDSYDQRSFHVAAQNLEGGLVGSIRLVLGAEAKDFPFENHCPTFDGFTFPPREQCAEVSRLVVRKSYRRRAGDSLQGVTREFREQEDVSGGGKAGKNANHDYRDRRSNRPQILLGMFREIYHFSRKNGINFWFACMERGLERILGQLGLHFIPIGPPADYYGTVTTYAANLNELEADLLQANAELSAWFQEDGGPHS